VTQLEQDLAVIPDMTSGQLRERWEQMGEGVAPRVPPSVLRRMLAQRLQERRHGGLPALVKREALRLASNADESEIPSHRPQVSPGTRLVREWNEQTISVDVLEEGFVYDNRTWRSLSEIARHVTGSHWSGPRFFGLTRNG
jgi:hypothetical protein